MTYYKDGREFVEVLVPAVPVEHVIDTTGAGDSFAGGLGYGFLQDPRNYIQAARYGNALGSLRTQGKTFEVFKSLEETNALIRDTYESGAI